MNNKILESSLLDEDYDNLNLRPLRLDEYIGQSETKEMLSVYIKAALSRDESLDHVLLYGPPGLGKTTLAKIIANELGVDIKTLSGPSVERAGDLASVLTSLNEGDVLFIDEIHRLPRFVEEMLYGAMEDYKLDLMIGKEQTAKSITVDLPPFTLVGATTRYGDLSSPLRDRFGVVLRLNYYSEDELEQIVKRSAHVYQSDIDTLACHEIALRSRGTPRIANRLLRRVRDFATVLGNGNITYSITNCALDKLNIDKNGLDVTDIKYLLCIINSFNGGPVGLDAISASIGEIKETIEDVYEPYLLQEGYIKRTPRGRIVTKKTYEHLGISSKGI